MEKAREDLIDLLIQYKLIKAHDITIVFDGYKAGHGNENKAVRGGIAVIYSKLAEKADEVIKRIITKDRKEWIVVTSDRDIVNHAWSVNSIPVPSESFLRIVSRETAGKAVHLSASPLGKGFHPSVSPLSKGGSEGGYKHGETAEGKDSGEYDEDSCAGKGNPYKPSKRERFVRRALSKL